MIVKPKIKFNVHLTTHPYGIKKFISEQIDYVKKQPKINGGPKTVLVIGSSSGYGLASRISLAFGSNALTIGVSTGGEPKNNRTGKAGFWNTYWFNRYAQDNNIPFHNFAGDAFSHKLKQEIVTYLKDTGKKIDLIVYSLASGVRINPDTNEKIVSALKPIGKDIDSYTIDISTLSKKPLNITKANDEEIKNTVYTMGGGDWLLWINTLVKNNVLNNNCKTIAYTYIGGKVTEDIYRNGTIGRAKIDLEATTTKIDDLLKGVGGKSHVVVSKAIVSKASVFIPSMVVYGSCLFNEMKKNNTHESVIAHKFRLFKDIIYGNNLDQEQDDNQRIRLDKFEMDDKVQKNTIEKMSLFNDDYKKFLELGGTKEFINNFYKINGFGYDSINYDEEVDIDQLLSEKEQAL